MGDEGHDRPLFGNTFLILLGGFTIMACTLLVILTDAGDIIKQDVRLGPAIAAAKVLIPVFTTIGMVVLLAKFKRCKVCGRVFFWRKDEGRDTH